MHRARSVGGGRWGGPVHGARPSAGGLAQLSHLAGNRAVARLLARSPSDAPPIKDRTRIDQLAKATVSAVDRCQAYAEMAGTQWVHMDPTNVHTAAVYQDGVNLDGLKQARDVPATTKWIDAAGGSTGGAPPAQVKGLAIVVNSNADRFEDEDYMVAAIRHEMVHVRLMRLTLKHRDAWKQGKSGLSFSQYVDKNVAGADRALVKDRYFGGHLDEVIAYLEGFLTAYAYSVVEQPQVADRPWIAHFKGFTKAYETARLNSGPLPKDLRRIPEENIAMKQAANAVGPEAEKLVKDYCDAAGDARRKNLAAWMERLYKTKGMYDAAVKMVYKVATKGKVIPEPKP